MVRIGKYRVSRSRAPAVNSRIERLSQLAPYSTDERTPLVRLAQEQRRAHDPYHLPLPFDPNFSFSNIEPSQPVVGHHGPLSPTMDRSPSTRTLTYRPRARTTRLLPVSTPAHHNLNSIDRYSPAFEGAHPYRSVLDRTPTPANVDGLEQPLSALQQDRQPSTPQSDTPRHNEVALWVSQVAIENPLLHAPVPTFPREMNCPLLGFSDVPTSYAATTTAPESSVSDSTMTLTLESRSDMSIEGQDSASDVTIRPIATGSFIGDAPHQLDTKRLRELSAQLIAIASTIQAMISSS